MLRFREPQAGKHGVAFAFNAGGGGITEGVDYGPLEEWEHELLGAFQGRETAKHWNGEKK